MSTWWNSQQGEGEYTLQFGTDNRAKFRLVEKAAQMAIDGKTVDDVSEMKHGEWVSLTECSNAGVYCSLCHKKVYKEDYAWCNRKNKLRSDYCPNCGAKMDGGRKNDGKG